MDVSTNPGHFKRILMAQITGTRIYFVAFLLFVIAANIQTTTFTTVISAHYLNYVEYLAVALLASKIFLFQKYTLFEAATSLTLVATSLVVLMMSTSFIPLYISMFMIGSKDIQLQDIVRWYFWITLIVMIFAFICSEMGLVQNLVYVRHGTSRQSFGIDYPTDFSAHVFYLCIAYCYLNFKKLNWIHYFVFILLAVFVYKFSDARLDMICILCIIPAMILAKSKHHLTGFGWGVTPIIAYSVMASVVLFSYNFKVLNKVNDFLSQRIRISSQGFFQYGINPFGSHVIERGWGASGGMSAYLGKVQDFQYFFLDSSFVRIFLIYGLVFALLILTMVGAAGYKATLIENNAYVAILFLIALSSMVDQHMLELAYNPFYLGFFSILAAKNHYLESGKRYDKVIHS